MEKAKRNSHLKYKNNFKTNNSIVNLKKSPFITDNLCPLYSKIAKIFDYRVIRNGTVVNVLENDPGFKVTHIEDLYYSLDL